MVAAAAALPKAASIALRARWLALSPMVWTFCVCIVEMLSLTLRHYVTYHLPSLRSGLISQAEHGLQPLQLTFLMKSPINGVQISSGLRIVPLVSGLSEYGSSIAAPHEPRAPSLDRDGSAPVATDRVLNLLTQRA